MNESEDMTNVLTSSRKHGRRKAEGERNTERADERRQLFLEAPVVSIGGSEQQLGVRLITQHVQAISVLCQATSRRRADWQSEWRDTKRTGFVQTSAPHS